MNQVLLPTSATPWERALAEGIAVSSEVGSAIGAMRRVKYLSPRPSMLPYLVWEYGLGELTPYVPNLYTLLDEGIRWQRLRGTVSAIAIGLAWIGYSAEVEEAWPGRRFWNSFQLRFPDLPAVDTPDLERIEGITSLSVPLRSKLRRGVHVYDVGPLEADHTRLDNSMLDFESGVAVTQAGTIWSFGRTHQISHQMTKAEGLAAGYWIEPDWTNPQDGSPRWVTLTAPWVDANFVWSTDQRTIRERLMAAWFEGRTVYLRLAQADGTTIGYRRARAVWRVEPRLNGTYAFDGSGYSPGTEGREVYVEALTQFDDASAVVATQASLVVGAARAQGVPPGRLWLGPNDLIGGTEVAAHEIEVPLRRTVREQFKFLLRFDLEPPMPVVPDEDFGRTALTENHFWMDI